MNGKFNSLKMLNVTHYYRSKKNRKWYLPFGYAAEDIELNNISLHIYQGEALAIIGEPGASKTLLGRIIAVTLNLIEVKLINRSLLIMVI